MINEAAGGDLRKSGSLTFGAGKVQYVAVVARLQTNVVLVVLR
jgi:hypothetical protein